MDIRIHEHHFPFAIRIAGQSSYKYWIESETNQAMLILFLYRFDTRDDYDSAEATPLTKSV